MGKMPDVYLWPPFAHTHTNKFVKFLVSSLANYFGKNKNLTKYMKNYERTQTQIPQTGLEAL